MNRLSRLKLTPIEQTAISTFSRRLKKSLGNQLLSIKLFGSKVRGDNHKDSDIDIYVIVKEKTIKVHEKIAEIDADIYDEYEVFLSPVVYSEYEERKNLEMHSFFFEAVQQEGIPL